MPVTKTQIMKALKNCYDPEIPVNIVDLGLVYGVKISGGNVSVKMTMTTPGCPMVSFITEDVRQKVLKVKGVKKVDVELTWDPPWSPERMKANVRKKLGI